MKLKFIEISGSFIAKYFSGSLIISSGNNGSTHVLKDLIDLLQWFSTFFWVLSALFKNDFPRYSLKSSKLKNKKRFFEIYLKLGKDISARTDEISLNFTENKARKKSCLMGHPSRNKTKLRDEADGNKKKAKGWLRTKVTLATEESRIFGWKKGSGMSEILATSLANALGGILIFQYFSLHTKRWRRFQRLPSNPLLFAWPLKL